MSSEGQGPSEITRTCRRVFGQGSVSNVRKRLSFMDGDEKKEERKKRPQEFRAAEVREFLQRAVPQRDYILEEIVDLIQIQFGKKYHKIRVTQLTYSQYTRSTLTPDAAYCICRHTRLS
ncbi:hypothetical protein J8273_2256 [Carpediemonas membranifera]|uniref:Transposase n=1 Tax=Carpediemonas membranifera TaxID=201153 RepID=A0A8J6B0P7_9EUKA|nr:hypothetical protein J8273_2256 [Carpediemonas membranifera]|eukprot:KAG9395910.1 hypothetical protein J8273_2256 [Carpediemonas membranifera]